MLVGQIRSLAQRFLIKGVLFSLAVLLPLAHANAGFFSFISDLIRPQTEAAAPERVANSQNLALLQATLNPKPALGMGGGDITVVDDALMPDIGPSGTLADVLDADVPVSGQISVYTVHAGDTISAIAKMYGVSVNTIVWANDLKNGVIHEGQSLVILPVNGVRHVVKQGDTIASIAKKYQGEAGEILEFNNLSAGAALAVGEEVVVPNGKIATPAPAKASSKAPTSKLRGVGGPDLGSYFIRPVYGGTISQGLHGYNGVDLAAPRGTTIVSAAAGVVIIARNSGWNGGYGKYVVVAHGNGTQTLYAHLDDVRTYEGAEIAQGQFIGYSGSTGKSTGPHLHFEVRGAKNPFAR